MSTSTAPIDVLLIGLGSIGTVYAYLLERSGRARVTAVARSNYDLYAKEGVTIKTDKFGTIEGWKPYRVVSSQSEALAQTPHFPLCLLTTKSLPDVLPTTRLLEPCISSGQIGAYSLIQNGLGVERALHEAVKDQGCPVMGGMAWIGVMTRDEGRVVEWRGPDTLVSGIYPPLPRAAPDQAHHTPSINTPPPATPAHRREFYQRETEALQLWRDLLEDGGANIKTTDHLDAVRYAKNIWNATWSSIQCLSRTYPSTFANLSSETVVPLKKLTREIVDVGFEAGLLREGDRQENLGKNMGGREDVAKECWDLITQMALSKIAAGHTPHKMSLWIDVEQSRPIEVEVIVGEVVKLAKEVGVDVPRLELVEALMRGVQADILERRGANL